MTLIATIAAAVLIVSLFYLDRDPDERTSRALFVPLLWCLIIGSRPVSMWLQLDRAANLADQYTESSPVDAAVFGILILAAALILNHRAVHVKRFLQGNLAILVYFFYCAISVAWADSPTIAAKRWIKAMGEFLIILVILTDANPRAAIKRVFASVSFVLLPLSVLFIKYYPNLGASYDLIDRIMYYYGVTSFKNELGLLCMVCGLTSLWSLLAAWQDRTLENRWRHLAAHALTILMAVWLVIKADSKTPLVSLGLAGAVMMLISFRNKEQKQPYVLGVVLGAICIALFAVFFDTAGTLVHALGRTTTLTGRTRIWAAVLAQPINPLVGTGFESFWMGTRMQSVWSMSQTGIEEAHDGYLELYLNLGWVGIACLCALIVTGYRHAAAMLRDDPQVGRLRIACFTAALVYNFTEAGFRMMNLVWFVFLLSITGVPLSLLQRAEQDSPSLLHPAVHPRPRTILQ